MGPAVAVPIYGQAESLNLATAAAICLYASASAQRSEPNGDQPSTQPALLSDGDGSSGLPEPA